MMRIIEGEKVNIKSWCMNPESEAIDQAQNLAKLPFVISHVALMPDTHCGYGMPIGGVIACRDVVIPNCVGVDIGCGMSAIKFPIKVLDDSLKDIIGKIREWIPVGFNHQQENQYWEGFDRAPIEIPIVKQELDAARRQLGTLGGGNHFIEIQKDQDEYIWAMVHSGSRNFGLKIANEYNGIAEAQARIYPDKQQKDLAWLEVDSHVGQEYIKSMNFALDFAYENRQHMLRMIRLAFEEYIHRDITPLASYNIHHNYAALETHFGEQVWVHRKGATSAKLGEIGIIPGSQGTKSYIVKGKGNPESFMSCSHGAGRALSRSKARKVLDLATEQEFLERQGILHSIRNQADLDEASSAYKSIDVVMEEQKDLVDVVFELRPLAVIKG